MSRSDVTAKKTPAILLIDRNLTARRSVVLGSAISELYEKEGKGLNPPPVEAALPTQRNKIEQFLRVQPFGSIFVAVTESELSTLSDGERLPRKPCDSISCGFEIINQKVGDHDLYFLTRDNITGVDIASLLLSGARGIIDLEALGSLEVVGRVIQATHDTDKELNRILVGDPYTKLDRLIDLVKNQMPVGHWNLLLALAEIPRVRLDVSGNVNQIKIAAALARWKDITGFQGSEQVTSRHLASVLNIIKRHVDVNPDEDNYDENEEDDEVESRSRTRYLTRGELKELPFLPAYARMFGLPRRLIPILGADESKLSTQLFKQGVMGMHVKSLYEGGVVKVGSVIMPSRSRPQEVKRNLRHKRGVKR